MKKLPILIISAKAYAEAFGLAGAASKKSHLSRTKRRLNQVLAEVRNLPMKLVDNSRDNEELFSPANNCNWEHLKAEGILPKMYAIQWED